MGFIPEDSEVNFILDLVDYANYNINIEPPTPPPMPPRPLTPQSLSIPPSSPELEPEPELLKSDFDDMPMEVKKLIN